MKKLIIILGLLLSSCVEPEVVKLKIHYMSCNETIHSKVVITHKVGDDYLVRINSYGGGLPIIYYRNPDTGFESKIYNVCELIKIERIK